MIWNYWPYWIGAAAGTFVVLEAVAIIWHWLFLRGKVSTDAKTLSQKVWAWLKVKAAGPWTWQHTTFAIVFAAFLVWLYVHLTFGRWG